ncbi:MAG: hypothetical protein QM237_07535 [Bacteroidota bacterium]|jgi:hypothetical protein|nr:hypothetical protein [Bacteroidota bacterium]HHU97576.1 hypothetical protein [Petrimonas sp.]
MRTAIYFSPILLFALLITSCTGKQRGGSGDGNNKQAAELTFDSIKLQEVNKLEAVEEPQPVNYNDFPVAYVKNGALHLFNPETDTIVPFSEETDSVFNCVYSDRDAMFYYTVSRQGILVMKKVDLSAIPVQPALLFNLNKATEKFFTETYGEKAKLSFVNNNLVLQNDFIWDYYDFTNFLNYSLENGTLETINYRQFEERYKYHPVSGEEPKRGYHSVYEKAKQLDLQPDDYMDDDFEIEFDFTGASADGSKVVFAIILGFGDLPHGPYCVANADGTMMQLLENTDLGSAFKPLWCNNNAVFLRSYDSETEKREWGEGKWIIELCYTRADDNAIMPIDRDVDYYAVRKIHPMQ